MSIRLASKRLTGHGRSTSAAVSYLEVWHFVTGGRVALARQACPNLPRHHHRRIHAGRQLGNNSEGVHNESDDMTNDTDLLNRYKQSLSFTPATHEIKDLDSGIPEGTEVVLHGYLGARRDAGKKLTFWHLTGRDLAHSVQIVSVAGKVRDGGNDPDSHGQPTNDPSELRMYHPGTPVTIKGEVKARKPAPKTSESKPGGGEGHGGGTSSLAAHVESVEVKVHSFELLNTMPKDVLMTRDAVYPPEQRHLAMRQEGGGPGSVLGALAFRNRVSRACRTLLEDEFNFTEVETPLLFKSTPEGAREFLVPTRSRNHLAYALPQSPQQFKQVLMGSGVSRYYQLARCFRDEDLRADRQPEFTQLDLEMSFAGSEDVMHVITTLIRRLWKDLLGIDSLPERFERLTYSEAMARYGSDKPDTRFAWEIARVDYMLPVDLVAKISGLTLPAVDAMLVRFDGHEDHAAQDHTDGAECGPSPSETRKFIASFLDSPAGAPFTSNPAGAPGIFIVDSSKPLSGLQPLGWEAAENLETMFSLRDGDLLLLQARPDTGRYFGGAGSTALGNLRLALHGAAVQAGLMAAARGFAPLWITDFPLFSRARAAEEPGQGGGAGLASTHHPFTAPKHAADVDRLLSAPEEVVGDHYDLVVNGIELGGGSRRIHDAAVQRLVMEKVLRMPQARVADFEHLLAVLRAGCPPHAGIALGFDRLVATMLARHSVRDVIAFPKTGRGEDPLMRCPGHVTAERLAEYHLRAQ